jgi:hypothetical protein
VKNNKYSGEKKVVKKEINIVVKKDRRHNRKATLHFYMVVEDKAKRSYDHDHLI